MTQYTIILNGQEGKATTIDFKGTFKQFKNQIMKEMKFVAANIYSLDENRRERQINSESEFKLLSADNGNIMIYAEEEILGNDNSINCKQDTRNLKSNLEDTNNSTSKNNKKSLSKISQLNTQKINFQERIILNKITVLLTTHHKLRRTVLKLLK